MSNLNIYLLQRKSIQGDDVEVADWDETKGFVIVAQSETEARELANDNCHGEGKIWNTIASTNGTFFQCELLGTSHLSTAKVLMADVNWG